MTKLANLGVAVRACCPSDRGPYTPYDRIQVESYSIDARQATATVRRLVAGDDVHVLHRAQTLAARSRVASAPKLWSLGSCHRPTMCDYACVRVDRLYVTFFKSIVDGVGAYVLGPC